MNKIRFLSWKGAIAGGHYEPAAVAGPFIFTAGQVPRDEKRNIIGDTIEEQTRAVLEKIRAILAEAGASITDIAQVRVHLSDLSLSPGFESVYVDFFGTHKPPRTVVGSQLNGVMVEIDVIAWVAR